MEIGMTEAKLSVPEDIRLYDEDSFLMGPSDDDDNERELDIDDIFAKDFDRVLKEARQYHDKSFLDPKGFHTHRPSDIDPDLYFVSFEGGTLLVHHDDNALIGGFIETDLSLDGDWQGQGLGTEIVVEHFMDSGSLPTWYLDSAAYSSAGHSTCLSAQAFPRVHPDIYFLKAARHVMIGNPKLFYPSVNEDGYETVLASLKDALAQSTPGGFAAASEEWLERRNAAKPR
jgi:hypothetical protein